MKQQDNDISVLDFKNKKFYMLIVVLFFIIVVIIYGIINQERESPKEEVLRIIENIKSHYGERVETLRKTSLYYQESGEYQKVGEVASNVLLELDKIDINPDTKYFKLKNNHYYLEYQDVIRTDKEISKNLRYQNYVLFNENVITKNNFTLYQDGKEKYVFYKSFEFPIIIKDYKNSYFVEYDSELFSIKKEDIKEIIKKTNTTKKNQNEITTLAYHQVGDDGEICEDAYVCITKENFDKEMKYLKDNNYFTLTMEELYQYLNGNLQIDKGIVLTFDDGFKTKSMIEILEKYDLMGTIFVITKYFDTMDEFQSKNLLVQSHTNNMHRNYVCSGGNQGGAMLCASEKDIKDDLEISIKKIGNDLWAMAYPFYDYNEKAIRMVQEAGFKMSFIGRGNAMGKATPLKTNLYKIPRMTVWNISIMNFNTWKSYL